MAGTSRKTTKNPPVLLRCLQRHFGTDPAELPVVQYHVAVIDRPNLHLAIEELLGSRGRKSELVGVLSLDQFQAATLGGLSRAASAKRFEQGPVEYVDVELPGNRKLSCVKNGLFLIREKDASFALLMGFPRFIHEANIQVEVMGRDRAGAEKLVGELQRLTNQGKAYRGHVLSLEQDCYRALTIKHHTLPAIRREDLILPEKLLQRIERHSLSFSKHAERLRSAGRHLKRGILLYGPPGTGKTLTAMYLVAQLPGRTVLLLTGAGIGSIEAACRLARILEPATVILEDVDLIGTQRDGQSIGANALLFELLNQMDGLADDVDIMFVLTTNRPDVLEPALAARPGRVDQAIEIPAPDTECRRRLFELYSRGLRVEVSNWEKIIERTAGVTGAFIRELLRKASIYAAEEDGASPLVVRHSHIEEALTELLVAGGPLTKSLLGAAAV